MRPRFDLSVYLVTDGPMTAARGLVATVAAAAAGGATIVQLREPGTPTRALIERARALKVLLEGAGLPLIVNDRVDVALAIGADGVHVGLNDMQPGDARRLLGPDAIIGWSVTGGEDLSSFDPAAVDYVGLGPVFPTTTKSDAAMPLGIAGVCALRPQIPVPVVAIGGITIDNAGETVAAGADGVAVVSAICAAADPESAAAGLAAAVATARAGTPSGKGTKP